MIRQLLLHSLLPTLGSCCLQLYVNTFTIFWDPYPLPTGIRKSESCTPSIHLSTKNLYCFYYNRAKSSYVDIVEMFALWTGCTDHLCTCRKHDQWLRGDQNTKLMILYPTVSFLHLQCDEMFFVFIPCCAMRSSPTYHRNDFVANVANIVDSKQNQSIFLPSSMPLKLIPWPGDFSYSQLQTDHFTACTCVMTIIAWYYRKFTYCYPYSAPSSKCHEVTVAWVLYNSSSATIMVYWLGYHLHLTKVSTYQATVSNVFQIISFTLETSSLPTSRSPTEKEASYVLLSYLHHT